MSTIKIGVSMTDALSSLSGGINKTVSLTQTGTRLNFERFTVTTGWTALPLGSVTLPAMMAIVNEDEAHIIELALDSGGANKIGPISAGNPHLQEVAAAATLYWKATTASVEVSLGLAEK